MSDTCCEAKACREEGPLREPEGCYSETPQGKDLKKWLRIARWFGIKIETKQEKLVKQNLSKPAVEEVIEEDDNDIYPESSEYWNRGSHWGWDAMFNVIGRYHFNVGLIHRYSKWSIGIEEQRFDRELRDTRWHNSVSATQILPFNEAYTGRPAVKLL